MCVCVCVCGGGGGGGVIWPPLNPENVTISRFQTYWSRTTFLTGTDPFWPYLPFPSEETQKVPLVGTFDESKARHVLGPVIHGLLYQSTCVA